MAITYPLNPPSISRYASIVISADDAVAGDGSPFTFEQSFQDWGGQRWLAEVQLPTMNEDCSSRWEAFLTSLRGRFGTFLLGDPARIAPRGDAIFLAISGTEGASSVTASLRGTMKAGDMFQIGGGSSSRLYKVLQDRTGDGTLEIWPSLRADASGVTATLSNPRGLFRLTDNQRAWAISNGRWRRIAFTAEEAL